MSYSRRSQIVIGLTVMLGVFVILGTVKYLKISAAIAEHMAFQMPPEAVTTSITKEIPWPKTLNAVGSAVAVQGVVLSAEADGVVRKVLVESGARVEAGQVLIELDSSVEEGNLKALVAIRDRSQRSYARTQKLMNDSAMSQADSETAEYVLRAAEGEVAAVQAQLAKKKIVAPFAGVLGVRRVNVGQYVTAGTEILPLFDLSSMYVDFSLPQSAATLIKTDLEVEAILDDPNLGTAKGTIAAFDPQIDPKTRTIHTRAIFPNPDVQIKPGMFARVQVLLSSDDRRIAIPTSSINYAPYGDSVFVAEEMKNPKGATFRGVRAQTVTLGEARGNLVAILTGLTVGQEVVSSGVFKLRPGAAISVHNELAPSEEANPSPADS